MALRLKDTIKKERREKKIQKGEEDTRLKYKKYHFRIPIQIIHIFIFPSTIIDFIFDGNIYMFHNKCHSNIFFIDAQKMLF